MLKVYTGIKWIKDKDNLNITIKDGDPVFAPTWDMVMGYKNGKITEKQYTDMYIIKMRGSYMNNRERWEELLSKDRIVLTCFCPKGTFCHRYLLADILVKLGGEYSGEL